MPEIPIKYLKYIDNTGNVQKAYGITVLKAVYDADGNTLDEILQTYDNKVGDTSSLTTTANTDLVSAINEVDGNVGDLSGLSTTAKNNLVAAVNELNQKSVFEQKTVHNISLDAGGTTVLRVSISDISRKVPVAIFDVSTACNLVINNAWPGSDIYNVSIGNVGATNMVNASITITFLINP